MTNSEFDQALVKAAFALSAERGWDRVTVAEAARRAELPLDRARARFPGRGMILARFGRIADQAALAGITSDEMADAPARDRLFDLVMRRIDALQANRAGMRSLFRALPRHPLTALMLAAASLGSMAWLLEGAGIDVTGPKGALRTQGLLAVWVYTVRAWEKDDSEDLSATMAALDRALDRAEQADASLLRGFGGRRAAPPPAAPPTPDTAAEAAQTFMELLPPEDEPPAPA
jgi:ubiquinone biosynthesis protein COQ9